MAEGSLLWTPGQEMMSGSNMRKFMDWVGGRKGLAFDDYSTLWKWSVENIDEFWKAVMEYFDVLHTGKAVRALESMDMPPKGWFSGVSLNYAENLFRDREGGTALLVRGEEGPVTEITWHRLRKMTASMAQCLRSAGVGRGDRVAGFLPNSAEAVVAFLAAASIGAVWSGCSPDLGSRSVIDRLEQIAPKVLVAVDGYSYGGKWFDRTGTVREVMEAVKPIRQLIMVKRSTGESGVEGALDWDECTGHDEELSFERVPFDHPLWILYSSGTTGLPKAIVQSHGGILLEHLKLLSLHADLKEGERFFWYTTTSWMMWNVLVSAMLVGASSILYDGSASYPGLDALWKLAEDTSMTLFGTSASFISACMKAGLEPGSTYDLSALKSVSYTGSPLSPEGFAWVYGSVGKDEWVTGISGGTDLCTAFLCGCPLLPVRAGELQCRALGADAASFSEDGREVVGEMGELVIRKPLPSMPVFFWNDGGNRRYTESYFSMFPGIWRHGDWVKITPGGGAVIYGRSDSTLKRHGVRIGSSEIYRCVESMPEIADSLVVGVEESGGGYYMPLFVVPSAGNVLDDRLAGLIRDRIRRELSPRHIPDDIIAIREVPRTLNGKKLEVPVKRILSGRETGAVVNTGSVSNPGALEFFVEFRKRGRKNG